MAVIGSHDHEIEVVWAGASMGAEIRAHHAPEAA
jgi:hypothetical protein